MLAISNYKTYQFYESSRILVIEMDHVLYIFDKYLDIVTYALAEFRLQTLSHVLEAKNMLKMPKTAVLEVDFPKRFSRRWIV